MPAFHSRLDTPDAMTLENSTTSHGQGSSVHDDAR
ncbi:Uncharacterised protein [Bordetella pertussis]|nr:Uncharacterised protein [Bordetella pertussis]CPO55318.1 Uncharacterised protein [Bordetella pertussis]